MWNRETGAEFAELASQAMELLALPYLEEERGGFYTREEAARAREEQLERVLRLLCGTAHADAFQHWLYADAPDDVTVEALDAKWVELGETFFSRRELGGGLRGRSKKGGRSSTCFSCLFTCSSTRWPTWARFRCGAVRLQTKRKRCENTEKPSRSAAVGPCRSFLRAAGATFAFDRETVGELAAFVASELNG